MYKNCIEMTQNKNSKCGCEPKPKPKCQKPVTCPKPCYKPIKYAGVCGTSCVRCGRCGKWDNKTSHCAVCNPITKCEPTCPKYFDDVIIHNNLTVCEDICLKSCSNIKFGGLAVSLDKVITVNQDKKLQLTLNGVEYLINLERLEKKKKCDKPETESSELSESDEQ